MLRFFRKELRRPPIRLPLGDLEAELVWKHIKNIHLRVLPPEGRVVISAPDRVSLETIRKFALSKTDWIKEQQKVIRGRKSEVSLRFEDGEDHDVWGSRYPLRVEEGHRSASVTLEGGQLLLRVRRKTTPAKKRAVVEAWYGEEVRKAALPLIAKWEPVMGVKVGRLFVRPMRTRWGSCNTATRDIRLNGELAKKPPEYLEYVVVHEMVHLLERGHNERFRGFMDGFLPDWKSRKKLLNHLFVGQEEDVSCATRPL